MGRDLLAELEDTADKLDPLEHEIACAWLAVRRAIEHIKTLNSQLDVIPEKRETAKLIERMMKPNQSIRSHCDEAAYTQCTNPLDNFKIYQDGVRCFAEQNGIVPWNDWTIDEDGGLTWRPKR